MDIVPLIKGEKSASVSARDIIWNFPNVWDGSGPGINLKCAIRHGDWKLIYDYASRRKELYNIPKDIGENNDLAEQEPKMVQTLSALLGKRLREMDAQRPLMKGTDVPCKWPDEQ